MISTSEFEKTSASPGFALGETTMTELNRRTLLTATAAGAAAAIVPAGTEPAQAAMPLQGKQNPGWYRYKVGNYEMTVVTDGAATFPLPEKFVANASKDQVSAELAKHHLDPAKVTVPFTPVVINTGSKLILIDTGFGEVAGAKPGASNGQMMNNMRAAGIDPKNIDLVIISHFHGDHVNGLLNTDNKLAFANAEVVVPSVEWKYWMDDGEMSRAPEGRMQGLFKNNRRVFDALGRKVGQYDWNKEVAPGLTAIGTPGHTLGHTSYVLASGNSKLFIQSDVTNVPFLFASHPDWHAGYDQVGDMAEATRRKTYDMIVAEKLPVQGFHYPFPGLGHLEKSGDGYRVVPAPWNPSI
jgi:glyoxylase-like metal-dependent hydrolase (beta-lactamase superfamily II)